MPEPKLKGKSYDIPKRLLWDAWQKVKENGGAAGADGVTIEQFEEALSRNLYRLWNRMSSGSRVCLAELIGALSLGTDLGLGHPMEHVLRQCVLALQLGERFGLGESERPVVY